MCLDLYILLYLCLGEGGKERKIGNKRERREEEGDIERGESEREVH